MRTTDWLELNLLLLIEPVGECARKMVYCEQWLFQSGQEDIYPLKMSFPLFTFEVKISHQEKWALCSTKWSKLMTFGNLDPTLKMLCVLLHSFDADTITDCERLC